MFAEVAVRYKAQIVEGAREKQGEAVTGTHSSSAHGSEFPTILTFVHKGSVWLFQLGLP